MLGTGGVDRINQGGQGGGFAAARLASDQHNAAVQLHQIHRYRGQAQGGQGRNLTAEQAYRRRQMALGAK